MDSFYEQPFIKKQPTGSERMKNMALLVGGMLITVLLAVGGILMLGKGFVTFIMLILAAAAGYGTFFMFRNTKVEYEYTFTNGDLDIDKIIAQSSRKPMINIQVSKFTDFGKYDGSAPEESADMTVIMATDNIASHEYYADFPHEDYGSTRLVFAPDEKMLNHIKKALHPALKNKNLSS